MNDYLTGNVNLDGVVRLSIQSSRDFINLYVFFSTKMSQFNF